MKTGAKRWLAVVLVLALALGSVATAQADPPPPLRRVNALYFDGPIRFSETAVFWFGQVTPTENYADVRVGYNNQELYVHVNVFDRRLWYDTEPSPDRLTAWDAVTLYLDLDGNAGGNPDKTAYRFVGQLNWWENPRTDWQAAYQGNGTEWITTAVPFTSTSGWRGNAPNDDVDDRGWSMVFDIPFASLGLSSPPSQGTMWRMALVLHDRDNAADMPNPDKMWPEAMDPNRPATWGQLVFGLPTYTPPLAVPGGTVTIRHQLNGATVVDGAVGGGSVCGEGLDFWTQWGEANYAGQTQFNVQNQIDVADWPCFSKYYVTFPLGAIPPGKVIISARLTLHQFGNAGQGAIPGPEPSFIQALAVAEDWNETTLNWNNAPLAAENVAAAWVDPLTSDPGVSGVPRTWDVSRTVAEAYAAGRPLHQALYSADGAYHSGRYFWAGDVEDWNAEARPTLTVVWGEPSATIHKKVWPVTATVGQRVTYTLQLLGAGHTLTLTDNLPIQVSAPGPVQGKEEGTIIYSPSTHQLAWTGSPTVGRSITLTFPVTVLMPGPTVVYNTVVLTDSMGSMSADTVALIVDARLVWLPLILRR